MITFLDAKARDYSNTLGQLERIIIILLEVLQLSIIYPNTIYPNKIYPNKPSRTEGRTFFSEITSYQTLFSEITSYQTLFSKITSYQLINPMDCRIKSIASNNGIYLYK